MVERTRNGRKPVPRDWHVRIGAKALIVRNRHVLVIKERRQDGSTFWTLPGGGVAPSETRRAGLRRELAEELQCRVGVGDSIVRCSYDHSSLAGVTTVYTVYRSRLVTHPTPNRDEGVVDLAWTLPASPPAKMLEPFREVLIRGVGLPEATEARTGE